MNLTDLTEVLRDRAEVADASHEARMAGVRARVSATRARRAVAGVACVVLAVVGIVYATLPRPQALPEPAVPPRSLPEYQQGTKLIGQAWGDLPTTTITLRFVPKSLDLWVFTRCDAGPDTALLMDNSVNGHSIADQNTCGGAGRPVDWSGIVVPGQPAVLTMTVTGKQFFDESNQLQSLPLPDKGSFAVGVGEAVPVDEYPLPPRPQTLATFPPQPGREPEFELRSDPSDPVARKELTVRWPGRSSLRAQMNTPGKVRVLVNDVQVIDISNWGYGVYQQEISPTDWERGPNFAEGQTVRITVIPERVTGDWLVTLTPRGR
ncbi:hypothetical protein [Lentzea sp. NPDC059081]|uniref:hypothetical protein n=1 Tax=Lentzea sp. NPDC059081 TaxID=3346719 RepID=UPI00369517B5